MWIDKKGLASMLDAVGFTIIVGLLVINVVLPSMNEERVVLDIASVHDDMLLLRFNAAELYPELGNISLTVAELAALQVSKGLDEDFVVLLSRCMDALLGRGVLWMATFEYRGSTILMGFPGMDQLEDVSMTLRSITIATGETVVSRLYV